MYARAFIFLHSCLSSGLVAHRLIFVVFLQCDLLDMPAVGQLEKDAKYALVYQLLKIFLTQRLDAYLEFEVANSTLMKSYGNVLSFFLPIIMGYCMS